MPIPLVRDPEKNWTKMVGDTNQIKMVNGILSERLISVVVPNDECHVEACIIHGLYASRPPAAARNFAAEYLHSQFSPTPTEEVNLVAWLEVLSACEDAIGVTFD